MLAQPVVKIQVFRHLGRTSGQGAEGGGTAAEAVETGATAVETDGVVAGTGRGVVEIEGAVVGRGAMHFVQIVEIEVMKKVETDWVVVVKASAPVVIVAVTGQNVVVS